MCLTGIPLIARPDRAALREAVSATENSVKVQITCLFESYSWLIIIFTLNW